MFFRSLRSARRATARHFVSPRPRRTSRDRYRSPGVEPLECRTLLSAVTFFEKFEGVDWISAGVGGIGSWHNGGGTATLTTTGVEGRVVAGYLYWQGVDLTARSGDGVYNNETVTFDGATVSGTSLGVGGTAGWGAGGSQAFRADVSSLLRTGDQTYTVAGLASKVGHGSNGASLVVLYQDGDRSNDRDLYVLDGNHVSGGLGADGLWSVALSGFVPHAGGVRAQMHLADGQGTSDASMQFSTDAAQTTIVDRPGVLDGRSVADMGKSRSIGNGLWDIHTFDISSLFGSSDETSVELRQMSASFDDLALVVAMFDTSSEPANRPPVASDALYVGDEDQPVSGQLAGFDGDGDPLTFAVASAPPWGRLIVDAETGAFHFTPTENASGSVTFTYTVSDGDAVSSSATVTLVIAPVNDLPALKTRHLDTDEDVALSGAIEAVDPDGDTLSFLLVDGPAHGDLVLLADGSYAYTPDPNYHGEDAFTVSVDDGRSAPVTGIVTVTVASVNDSPVATSAAVTVIDNSPVGTVVAAVAASDVDGDAVSFAITSGNELGAFAVDAAGKITVVDRRPLDYRSNPEFRLTVLVTDGYGGSATAEIVVQVVRMPVDVGIGLDGKRPTLNLKGLPFHFVVIYSTATFDARTLDLNSLTFGATGEEDSLVRLGRNRARRFTSDVNRDGLTDLVLLFNLEETGLEKGEGSATVKGRTTDGTDFVGSVPVTIEDGYGKKKGTKNKDAKEKKK